jgi:hypothetical protein
MDFDPRSIDESRDPLTVGAFRVVPAGDLRDGQDRPLDPHRGDLRARAL